MAWRTIKFICGHEEDVQLYGKGKDRDRRAEWLSHHECTACQRARRAALIMDFEEKHDLPQLEGTEKQIAWAKDIRVSAIAAAEKLIEDGEDQIKAAEAVIEERGEAWAAKCTESREVLEYWKMALEELTEETSCRFWIDNRETDWQRGIQILAKEIKDRVEADPVEIELEQAVVEEETVTPESPKTEAVVVISVKKMEDSITVECRSDYDPAIPPVLKEAGCRWDGEEHIWAFRTDATTGEPEDRAAEIGNGLLLAGIPVRIADKAIREMAINATFEPRWRRWVSRANGKFLIESEDEEQKRIAARLPKAFSLRNGVSVPPAMWESVVEFAEVGGYRLTPGARELMEEERSKSVKVAKPQEAEYANMSNQKALRHDEDVLAELTED